MTVDVFIRSTSEQNEDQLRRAMHSLTFERWVKEEVRIQRLVDFGIREGRAKAEEMAESDPYIYTDNDVLIVGKDWVKRAASAILTYPEYAAVSSLSLVEGENQAKCPPEYDGMTLIYPMHAVGAPMIIRKGFFKFALGPNLFDPADLAPVVPEMDLNSECGVLHKYCLDRGWKEGLVNGLRHNHLGHGFSSNPALHWGV